MYSSLNESALSNLRSSSNKLNSRSTRNSSGHAKKTASQRPRLLLNTTPLYHRLSPGTSTAKTADRRFVNISPTSNVFLSTISNTLQGQKRTLRTACSRQPRRVARNRKNSEITLLSGDKLISPNNQDDSGVFPSWLIDRQDFQATRAPSHSVADIPKVVSIFPAYFRSDVEKEALFNWVHTVKFFSMIPNTIIKDICDRLTRHDYEKGSYIINKGDIGDCCFIIFQGKVGIILDHDNINSVTGPGEVLGEHALDTEKPRSADARCLESVIAFKLKKIDYDSILISFKKLEKHENTKFLMGAKFFEFWSFNKNQNLSNYLIQKNYAAGEVLFDIGSESNTFYIIKSGEVLIQTYVKIHEKNRWPTGSSNWKVREINKKYLFSISNLKAGMFFGEHGIIHQTERVVRATCISKVVTLNINKDEFFDLFSAKDIENLQDYSTIKIPSEKELEEKLMEELRNKKIINQALIDAMEINFKNPEGRESLLDPKTKKLRNWIMCRKRRNLVCTNEIKKRIVSENNCIVKLDSISELNSYNKSEKSHKS